MAKGYRFHLTNDQTKVMACRAIMAAPWGATASVDPQTRTLDQNAKMHAMLSDIAMAKPMGRRHTPDDWKAILMHACGWECQFLEGLDGRPFPQGFRSSKLNKAQMATLITYMQAFGDEHGVQWSEPLRQEAA